MALAVLSGVAGGSGYGAQNNTQSIITDQDTVARFTAELIAEHMAAQQRAVNDPTKPSSLKNPPEGSAVQPVAKAEETPAKKSRGKS